MAFSHTHSEFILFYLPMFVLMFIASPPEAFFKKIGLSHDIWFMVLLLIGFGIPYLGRLIVWLVFRIKLHGSKDWKVWLDSSYNDWYYKVLNAYLCICFVLIVGGFSLRVLSWFGMFS